MLLSPRKPVAKQSSLRSEKSGKSAFKGRFRPKLEQLENRLAPVVSWDGGAGTLNWKDAPNWSTDSLPGSTDDVVIGSAFAGQTITSGADVTIKSVTSAASLTITAQ